MLCNCEKINLAMTNQDGPQCYVNHLSDEDSHHSFDDDVLSTYSVKLRDASNIQLRRSNKHDDESENAIEGEPLLSRTASCPNLNVNLLFGVFNVTETLCITTS